MNKNTEYIGVYQKREDYIAKIGKEVIANHFTNPEAAAAAYNIVAKALGITMLNEQPEVVAKEEVYKSHWFSDPDIGIWWSNKKLKQKYYEALYK